MKKIFYLICFLISLTGLVPDNTETQNHRIDETGSAGMISALGGAPVIADKPAAKVFVCKSGTAYAYHSTTGCRGLQRCTHEIVSMTVGEAVDYGYRPCKLCE